MKFLNHDGVIAWRQKKEQDEIALAQELGNLFWNDSILRRTAEQQMSVLVTDMLERHSTELDDLGIAPHARDSSHQTSLEMAVADEKNLRLWRKAIDGATPTGVISVLNQLQNGECDIDDCADILRLYGCFAEKADLGVKVKDTAYGEGPKDKRSEKTDSTDPMAGAFGKIQSGKQIPGKDQVVNLQAGSAKFRSRGASAAVLGKEKADKFGQFSRQKFAVPPHVREVLRSALRDEQIDEKITLASGCNRWALRMQSKSCQVDKAFGLPFGGDISGTTSDAVYGLEVAASLTQKHDADIDCLDFLVLLPLISLVQSYHHTLLEVALAFMYCNIIDDYKIGYYTSLFPKACKKNKYTSIWETLEKFEKNSPKMLVYTRQDLLNIGEAKVLRGFLMEPGYEQDTFKSIASVKDFYGARGRTQQPSLMYPHNSAHVIASLVFDSGHRHLARRMAKAVALYDKQTGGYTRRRFMPKNLPSLCNTETEYLRSRFKPRAGNAPVRASA